jgi:capsular polysaccharide biosynthesis protein
VALVDLLRIIRRRWWLVTAATVAAATIGFTVATLATATYVASAQVVAVVVGTEDPTNETGMTEGLAAEQFSRSRIPEYTSFADTETFLQRVVDDRQLPITRDQLSRSLLMSSPRNTAIITVTVRSDSPVLAADVANASAEELAQVVRERDAQLPIRSVVADRATVPVSRATPQLWRTVAQSAVLGLIFGTVAAVGVALVHHSGESEAVS